MDKFERDVPKKKSVFGNFGTLCIGLGCVRSRFIAVSVLWRGEHKSFIVVFVCVLYRARVFYYLFSTVICAVGMMDGQKTVSKLRIESVW